MLPSRAFRNVGIPPPLRSLITLHPSMPGTLKAQLRLRLGSIAGSRISLPAPPSRGYSTPAAPTNTTAEASSTTPAEEASSEPTTTYQPLPERMVPKYSLTFTCTVCKTRSSHTCSKQAYSSGIVLIECPGCKNRHLIADHLGWFKDSTEGGKNRTIEDLLAAKGESVTRGQITDSGDIEYYEP
ncbi:zf-DNL-domain-containing protein [Cylindrobasidium torrendii FP15055 ss-10]|uniref:Zf-DNL-domain-containing protein n=1 Tax=Cylindrobasidium torrendii FP15055 ss-10 TaxID=1314674 RepID=A0A0D7BI15_9AGAR|nr:zf-DNL-domain-containing protein [Cylindrobasidium torrendii FP15055 ss-10]